MIGNSIAGFLGEGVAVSASSFESIATATGTGSSDLITFSSIPSTYSHLQIRWTASDTSGISGGMNVWMQFNTDTAGSNYTRHGLIGNGTSASATGTANASIIVINSAGVYGTSGLGGAIVDIIDYASTTKYKTIRGFSGANNNTTSTDFKVALSSGLWMSTSAINKIRLISDNAAFTTTSTFALYGIKG